MKTTEGTEITEKEKRDFTLSVHSVFSVVKSKIE